MKWLWGFLTFLTGLGFASEVFVNAFVRPELIPLLVWAGVSSFFAWLMRRELEHESLRRR